MPVKPIPDGYHTVTPYLVVEGAAQLIDFLKTAFDAQERFRMDGPDGVVRHAEVQIGDSRIMMGEACAQQKAMPTMIYMYVNDADALYRRAMAAGATSVAEPSDQFYGDRHGGVKDASGNLWFIATHKEDVTKEEMERRAQAAMKQKTAG